MQGPKLEESFLRRVFEEIAAEQNAATGRTWSPSNERTNAGNVQYWEQYRHLWRQEDVKIIEVILSEIASCGSIKLFCKTHNFKDSTLMSALRGRTAVGGELGSAVGYRKTADTWRKLDSWFERGVGDGVSFNRYLRSYSHLWSPEDYKVKEDAIKLVIAYGSAPAVERVYGVSFSNFTLYVRTSQPLPQEMAALAGWERVPGQWVKIAA